MGGLLYYNKPMMKNTVTTKPKTSLVLFFLVLLLLSVFINLPYKQAGFVLDGHYVVEQNPVIKQPELYGKIFTGGLFDAYKSSLAGTFQYYRPLLLLSYVIDYNIWGLEAFGYRLGNILIHYCNCLLLFSMVLLLFKRHRLAILSSLIFCVLPAHEWVIRYVVGRGDLLQAFHSLLSLNLLILAIQSKNRVLYILSILLFVMAVFSREVAVILPLFAGLVAYRYDRSSRQASWRVIPFVVISGLYFLFRQKFIPVIGQAYIEALNFSFILETIVAMFQYVFRLFITWPVLFSTADFIKSPIFQVFFVLAFAGGGFWIVRKTGQKEHSSPFGFGLIWLVFGMLPFVMTGAMHERLGPYLSEHFLYFLSIGFSIMLASLVLALKNSLMRRLIVVLLLVFYIPIGYVNNSAWQNEQMVLNKVKSLEPGPHTVAWQQYQMRFTDNPKAVQELIEEAQGDEEKSLWLKKMGHLYRMEGQYFKAIEYFNHAIALNSLNLEALNELAVCYLETGDQPKGLFLLNQSLEIDPMYSETYRLLGMAYYRTLDFSSAVDYLVQANFYNPEHMNTVLYLTMAYFFDHEEEEYYQWIEYAFRQYMESSAILKFVALEFYNHGYLVNALTLLEKAGDLIATDTELQQIQAHLYLNLGQYDKALIQWKKILNVDPANEDARNAVLALETQTRPTQGSMDNFEKKP
jgi:tetratricopeptide (TPR) repeat protein